MAQSEGRRQVAYKLVVGGKETKVTADIFSAGAEENLVPDGEKALVGGRRRADAAGGSGEGGGRGRRALVEDVVDDDRVAAAAKAN